MHPTAPDRPLTVDEDGFVAVVDATADDGFVGPLGPDTADAEIEAGGPVDGVEESSVAALRLTAPGARLTDDTQLTTAARFAEEGPIRAGTPSLALATGRYRVTVQIVRTEPWSDRRGRLLLESIDEGTTVVETPSPWSSL